MTEKGLNALRKIAAEFPNMPAPPGGWGPDGVDENAPVIKPKKKPRATPRPPRKPARPPRRTPKSKLDELSETHRQIDNDPTIPPENKEAEKQAATDQWNQRNFR